MIRFLYFDLGNVILAFDHGVACRQIADVASLSPATVRQLVFDSGLQWRMETGQATGEEFAAMIEDAAGRPVDRAALWQAAGAIFEPIGPVLGIVAHLEAAGYRLGILSNTCDIHWDYVASGRYRLIPDAFECLALSYRLGMCKPDPEIYRRAAALAEVAAEEIFFTDDRAENVSGARLVGYDAVLFTSPVQLVTELRSRGMRISW